MSCDPTPAPPSAELLRLVGMTTEEWAAAEKRFARYRFDPHAPLPMVFGPSRPFSKAELVWRPTYSDRREAAILDTITTGEFPAKPSEASP